MKTLVKIICTIGIIIAFLVLSVLKNAAMGSTSGTIINIILLLGAIGGIYGVWKKKGNTESRDLDIPSKDTDLKKD